MNKKEILDLNKFLLKKFSEVKHGGKTNDNTELHFDNINHLLEYPNHKERKFVKINIECREGISDESAGLSISLGNDYSSFTETIRYYLRYDDLDWGFRFDDELRKHLRELKTWYSPLTKFNLTIGIPILYLVLILLIGGIDSTMKIFGYSGYIQYSDSSQEGGHYFGVVLGLFLFSIGYVCELIGSLTNPVN